MSIKIENLTMSFGNHLVFRSHSLLAPEKGLVALRGRNGSGKTTLLKILSTLIEPSSGQAWVCGHSIRDEAQTVKKKIGVVLANDGGFFRHLSGNENLELFAQLRGTSPEEFRCTMELWEEVLPSLSEARKIPVALASAGMKQALALCRAVLHQPSVLFLDEPTRSLDAEAQRAIRASLKILSKRVLVLVATHDERDWKEADLIWDLGSDRYLGGGHGILASR